MAATTSKLEFLQRLSAEGQAEELQTAISRCSCKELRGLIGLLGVPVRSKGYAIYNNKAGYSELLSQLLTCKTDPKELLATSSSKRKTKNCNLRLANVIFGEVLATCVDAMNAEPTQTALDSDQVVAKNPFWEKARVEFVRLDEEYSRVVFQENCFEGFELGTPVHHSSDKLWKMWRELCAAYTSAAARFERAGGSDADFCSFCRNRVDVCYLRCWLNVKPHLLVSVNGKLLPGGQSSSLATQTVEEVVEADEGYRASSNKRSSGEMGNVLESVRTEAANWDEQRTRLIKSIKQTCKSLEAVREAEIGSEVEEVVRNELVWYAKRLKRIQEEDAVEC
jgi:hypothetical protein